MSKTLKNSFPVLGRALDWIEARILHLLEPARIPLMVLVRTGRTLRRRPSERRTH